MPPSFCATPCCSKENRKGHSAAVLGRTLLLLLAMSWVLEIPPVQARVYNVGDGQEFPAIQEAPLDTLNPGDVVRIHYRAEPYRERFILRRSGTATQPIVITGVADQGKFPLIDGADAKQLQKERSRQPGRWLIKVGDDVAAEHVHIEKLQLQNANNTQSFDYQGEKSLYTDNAAAILVQQGHHVVIDQCVLHGCGNGIQTSYAPNVSHLTIRGCWIYDNGNHANLESGQEHNVYLGGSYTTVEFCRFDHTHADGNNIKDRGFQTIIRYNWIEESLNRQLDLVDYKDYRGADAYVYGNVLIQHPRPHNRTMIHWGGDGDYSRSGKLYFFNNTVVAKARGAQFFSVDRVDCGIVLTNNVFVGAGQLWKGQGTIEGSHNWFAINVKLPMLWEAMQLGVQGADPLFCGIKDLPYFPCITSPLLNAGLNELPQPVRFMPSPSFSLQPRPKAGPMDVGAFELPIVKRRR